MVPLPSALVRPRSQPLTTRVSLSAAPLALAAFLTAGAAFRLYGLGQKSIWLDEAFSLAISQRSIPELLRLVVLTDTHPPLYYLLLNLWLRWDTGEAWARLLSAMFSTAAIPLMYLVGRALYNDVRSGVLAAAILALSPFHIWYAQEARMYAMLSFFVLAAAYFFLLGLRRGGVLSWAGYVLSMALALYTDSGAIWYLLATNLFFLSSVRLLRRKAAPWAISQLALAILYAPWLPSLWSQTRRVTENFWLPAPSFQVVLGTFLDFHSFNLPWLAPSIFYIAAILVFAYVVPDARGWQRRLLSLWLFAPLIASLLLSLRQPIFLSRNLIAASLGYCLLAAATIGRFQQRRPLALLLTPLLLMNLASIAHNTWSEDKEDWRSAAAYVAGQEAGHADGLVVFVPSYAELPFQYYFERYGVRLATQGYPQDEILLHESPRRVEDLDALLGGRPYVWLVLRDAEAADPQGAVKAWLDTHGYVRVGDFQRPDLAVISYVRWDVWQAQSRALAAAKAGAGLTDPCVTLAIPHRCLRPAPHAGPRKSLRHQIDRPGESLSEIDRRYGTTVARWIEANNLPDPNRTYVGKKLAIP